jgi:hypothetical protein
MEWLIDLFTFLISIFNVFAILTIYFLSKLLYAKHLTTANVVQKGTNRFRSFMFKYGTIIATTMTVTTV